jgi:hypothetical protein
LVYEALDDKIELNRQMNEMLEAMARSSVAKNIFSAQGHQRLFLRQQSERGSRQTSLGPSRHLCSIF